MHNSRRVPIVELNDYLTCKLCKGYYIDATTIIECLHTFCRSCIVQYLESNKYCPVCDVQVHKSKPLLNIRPDKVLQDIVYKLVPRLFQNEMCKRRQFYTLHPDVRPSNLEQCGEASYQHILSPDETICITLNYTGNVGPPRYLRCPAAVSIVHLQKLLRSKYGLADKFRVDIFHNQDCLSPHITLIDIAYIYLWKRKGPLELTYRIYENRITNFKAELLFPSNLQQPHGVSETISTSKSVSEPGSNQTATNWKEVQLTISENGEMCFTDVDSTSILNQEVTKCKNTPVSEPFPNSSPINSHNVALTTDKDNEDAILKNDNVETQTEEKIDDADNSKKTPETLKDTTVSILTNAGCDSKLNAIVNCVSTTLSINCTTSDTISTVSNLATNLNSIKSPSITTGKELFNGKHKTESNLEEEPPVKQAKPTILNHTLNLGATNLSNHHPLKQISQTRNSIESIGSPSAFMANTIDTEAVSKSKTINVVTTQSSSIQPKTTIINKECHIISSNTNFTVVPQWQLNKSPPKLPCYSPKVVQSPVLIVPKVQTSSTILKSKVPITTILNHKMALKNKPVNTYKTLREPPRTWNPQIPRSLLLKGVDQKDPDLKNAKPAKFFKIRNNMPRYLGNPSSGVKPLYQVHTSPEKDKNTGANAKIDKKEIRKHSIVKIDPKTLKPISEKAPESTSLSNQAELKINTSSVPIFSPLKLQSSPKSEQKSPKSEKKSPNSPQSPKSKACSPSSKREKLSLGYVPPNPFIPNLASPTLSPNQFLYPPGFPTYDQRLMAAYHNLLFGQQFAFASHPVQNLNFDLTQRKTFDSPTCTSPITPKAPLQLSKEKCNSKKSNTETKLKSRTDCSASLQNSAQDLNSSPRNTKKAKMKQKELPKNEKSLENALEKLTQKVSKLNKTDMKNDKNSIEKELNDDDTATQNNVSCKDVASSVSDVNKANSNNCTNTDVTKGESKIKEKETDIQSIQNGDNKTMSSNNNTIESVSFEDVENV